MFLFYFILSDWRIYNKVLVLLKVGPKSDFISFLIRKIPESLISLSLHMPRYTRKYSPNDSYLEARKRLLPGAELPGTLILDSPATLDLGEMYACCLSCPVCGILLWKCEQTVTLSTSLTTMVPPTPAPNSLWSSQRFFFFNVPFQNSCSMLTFIATLVSICRESDAYASSESRQCPLLFPHA